MDLLIQVSFILLLDSRILLGELDIPLLGIRLRELLKETNQLRVKCAKGGHYFLLGCSDPSLDFLRGGAV